MVQRLVWVIVIGVMAAGCQSEEESAATVLKATAVVTTSTDNANPAPQTLTPATATVAVAEFHPPFPGRTELFAPPRGAQTTVRRDDEHGDTIELKGFLNVNGPQVVLSIDGVLSPIPAGGEKYGVQVISINPPQAVLQRGRSRWTASLE